MPPELDRSGRAGEESIVQTIPLGDWRLHVIEAGIQRQDGGSIFGIIPRRRWSSAHPPDESNRVQLALRCLLIETGDALVLVDTGTGDRPDERFLAANGVENEAPSGVRGTDRLEAAILALGLDPADIGIVINTHLHFDHAGGNTCLVGGAIVPRFRNARYFVQRGELEYARDRRNERIRAAYRSDDFEPLAAANRLELLDGDSSVLPGISAFVTPGHTPHHQSVLIASAGQIACFSGDVIPTMAHLPLSWTMAFDVEPLRTMDAKKGLLERAVAGDWLLITPHDPHCCFSRVVMEGAGIRPRGT
jgi:glyoxylase-like metal-dependent hydrolase (beta-lactamase superfamily II)